MDKYQEIQIFFLYCALFEPVYVSDNAAFYDTFAISRLLNRELLTILAKLP